MSLLDDLNEIEIMLKERESNEYERDKLPVYISMDDLDDIFEFRHPDTIELMTKCYGLEVLKNCVFTRQLIQKLHAYGDRITDTAWERLQDYFRADSREQLVHWAYSR